MRTHVWYSISRKIAYQFCGRCGLICLRNPATAKAMRAACTGREDD